MAPFHETFLAWRMFRRKPVPDLIGVDAGSPTRTCAKQRIKRSVRLAPSFQRALELHQRGDLPGAERAYRAILQSAPRHFASLHLLGLIKAQQRQFSEAHRLLSRAVEAEPNSLPALSTLAGVLLALGREAEALAICDRILRLEPDDTDAHYHRGLLLARLGRLAEALEAYGRALRGKPDFVAALVNRGNLLTELDRPAEALADLDRAIALNPQHAEAHNSRGVALADLGRRDDALAAYGGAVALKPDYAEARNNRGLLLTSLNRHAEALDDYARAQALKPDFADVHNNRGLALHELHRHAEALASYDRALALRPDFAEARFNQSLTRLALGDFAAGWPGYEWRWKTRKSTAPWRDFPEPLWLGTDALAGKTILLHAEQGFGDTINFARYVPMVAARGGRVVVETQSALRGLIARLDGVADVVERGAALPAFDCHCPLGSLPLAFATELATIPANVAYVTADPARTADWRDRLPRSGRPVIGIAWSGNPHFRGDHNRSMTLARFAPIAAAADAAFVTLNPGLNECDTAALAAHPHVGNLAAEFRDFDDTAAVVADLDLVVTTDTSIAHLAGALGKPVWILLSRSPDWRWLLEREDCPWYPTARLFRQSMLGDWSPVIARVRQELENFIATRRAAR
jgi:tetratricopeptide (TPR) repeat protein